MIIHHQDQTKMVVDKAKKAEITSDGRIFIAYQSPSTKWRGIVEFSAEEVVLILAAASKQHRKDAREVLGSL